MPTFDRDAVTDAYRALTEAETLASWGQRRNSTHKATPQLWSERWVQSFDSLSPEDYPLDIIVGHDNGFRATSQARERFLSEVARLGPNVLYDDEALRIIGEYVGLSAFLHPQQALDYGAGTPYRRMGRDRYAAFRGVRTGTLMDDEGAVIIDVTDWGRLYTCAEFCAAFQLPIPSDMPPGQ